MSLFSFITPTIASVFLIVGLIGLVGRKSWGQGVRSMLQMIPLGNAKLWAIVFIAIGLIFGGIAATTTGAKSLIAMIGGSASTGTILGGEEQATIGITGLDCKISAVGGAGAGSGGISVRSDTNDLKHYYADVRYMNFSQNIQMNVTCDRAGDVSKGGVVTCIAEADSFKSETSTTDSNTYYFVSTSTAKSVIPGITWQQAIYLKDGIPATTSSTKEKIQFVFAQDEANQDLGVLITLPGTTVGGYLLNQSSGDVTVKCDGVEQARLTIVKLADA